MTRIPYCTHQQRRRRMYINYALNGLLFGLLMLTFGWALTEGMGRECHRIEVACKIDKAHGYETGSCNTESAGK